MLGDQSDFLGRLRATLPSRWFGDDRLVLDAALSGLAAGWEVVFCLFSKVSRQTRIATATGLWLDMAARDYFGGRLRRRSGESDSALRGRILLEINRQRGTRKAILAVLTDLTGRIPVVFEPARPTDTGAWNCAAGYGAAGGWGSLNLPFQCFVTAYRPRGSGIAQVAGWASPAGGYGQGAIEYASRDMVQGQVTDADVSAAVASVLPVASIAWTRITS